MRSARWLAVLGAVLLCCQSARGQDEPPDLTLAVTASTPGAVTLTLDARGADAFDSVQLMIDGIPLATCANTPCEVTWATTSATSGPHEAWGEGTVGESSFRSSAITLDVDNTLDVEVPASASGVVTISADARSLRGWAADLHVFVDGAVVGGCSSIPCALVWDTATVGNGAHTVWAVASDGQSSITSSEVAVEVANRPALNVVVSVPPLASGTVLITAEPSPSLAWGEWLGILIDGVVVATCDQPGAGPCRYAWDTASAANGSHRVWAVAGRSGRAGVDLVSDVVSVDVDNAPPTAVSAASSFSPPAVPSSATPSQLWSPLSGSSPPLLASPPISAPSSPPPPAASSSSVTTSQPLRYIRQAPPCRFPPRPRAARDSAAGVAPGVRPGRRRPPP
jgi:hypothetical protein